MYFSFIKLKDMKTQITKDNFYLSTKGRFQEVEIPNGEPSYISKTTYGKISSIYYYTNDGVIRVSDHWGGVASCQWNLDTVNEFGFDKCRKTELKAGYISFNELNEVYHLSYNLLIALDENNIEEINKIKELLKNRF